MSWSLNIGKVAGTVVRLHITFVLFLAWIFASSYASNGATAAWKTLLFVVLLFLCVLLHEFGHIFTARAFGVPTPYVTLLPIGGVAQLERIPEDPWEEFLIAIAGPAVNVVIACALIVFAHAHLRTSAAIGVDDMQMAMVDRLATLNLFLALFNLIPAFPMDGGRVLRAALASRMGFVRATERAASIGQFHSLRARLHRALPQSHPRLCRHLRLPGSLLGSTLGRLARRIAWRAGAPGDDDALRHAAAGDSH